MRKSFFHITLMVISLAILTITSSYGQPDVKSRLLKNIVKTENGKFIAEEYGSLVDVKANFLEVEITATAPANIMSHDNFISIYSEMGISVLSSTLKDIEAKPNDAFQLIRHSKLQKPANIIIRIEMNKDGLNYKVNSGTSYSSSNTLSWDQFFSGNN
jgi:hypothetical protein